MIEFKYDFLKFWKLEIILSCIAMVLYYWLFSNKLNNTHAIKFGDMIIPYIFWMMSSIVSGMILGIIFTTDKIED